MAERLIWKKDMSQDFIKTLSDEEIINELTKHGIDLDMVNTLDREDLLKAVDSLSELYYSDLEDFENKIVPMINKQTLNGMIIMSDGNKVIPTLTELMLDGIYPLSYLEGKLIDDGSGLILEADDGTQYKLYGIPEDGLELANFVNECLPGLREDAVDDLIDQGYDESAAEEMVMNEALYEYLRDEETIESYCDPVALDEYRPRIVNELITNESLGESMSDLEKLDSFLGIDDVDESLAEDFTGVLSTDEFESVISGGLGRNRGNRDDSFISDDIGDVIGRQLERLGLDFDDFSDYTEMYSALDDKGKRIVSNRLRKHIDFRDIDESLTEDADEYYVLSISDRGGDSDYIKGPMTKEEATNYAKISRKNASKYYREKYLVYPKNKIPGRYKHLLANESLQESISLDQADREKLVDELSQIKSMDRNKLYDLDLLTTDLSDGSVEELFPVTTKLIVSFLSEMANITKEELADKDQINIWWTDGDLFDDRDWEALFNGADKLINGKKRVLWKVYYSPYLDEDLNSDVYDALSDVAYDYEVNKNEPVYVDDFEEAEKNFNDKFFDGLTRDDYDESLTESLSNELQNKIKEICDVMIANLEKEDLEYIIEEPPYSEDGILSNDDLADLDGDESEIAEFAINYIKSKI